MSLLTHVNKNASCLPLFCSPNSLVFYLNDSNTLSQVLTLYNPYEFAVRYKVLCTAPQTYSIVEPHGEIHSKHSVDIIIRLVDKFLLSSSSNHQVVHRVRIQLFNHRKSKELLGKRDINCTVLSYKPSDRNVDDSTNKLSNKIELNTNPQQRISRLQPQDPILVVVLAILGAMCTCILMMPTVSDTATGFIIDVPSYLHMTVKSKIIAGYILGLVTVVLVRR